MQTFPHPQIQVNKRKTESISTKKRNRRGSRVSVRAPKKRGSAIAFLIEIMKNAVIRILFLSPKMKTEDDKTTLDVMFFC